MAVLSNNGRLIVTLPVAPELQTTDQFIIQSVSDVNPNGVTRRVNYGFLFSDLNSLILTNIQNNPYKFSGSFYSPDNYSSNLYTVKIRDGLTVTTGGITVSSGVSAFQSVTATQFNGPLTGNVNASSILVSGTGNFGTIIVANTIAGNINSSGLSTFANLQMAGGIIGGLPGAITINNSPIGNTAPAYLRGTTVTASLGFQSLGNASVTGNLRVSNTIISSVLSGSRITGSKGITGSLKGTFTGDIFSPTGVKILENGTGLAKNALFYGSSSYAFTSSRALTASYALFTSIAPVNNVNFAISASYASSSRFSIFSFSSSYASSSNQSIFSFSSSYASSSTFSFKSVLGLSSSYASSSRYSTFSISSSYASSSYTSSYIKQISSGQTNSIPFYDGTSLVAASQLNYYPYGNDLILKFSGSYNNLYNFNNYCISVESPGSNNNFSSQLVLSTDCRTNRNLVFPNIYESVGGPEGWSLKTYNSGSFSLQSWWESYNFSNSIYVTKLNNNAKNTDYFEVLKIKNNDFYLWGDSYTKNSAMRDGTIGIGVLQPTNQTQNRTNKARVHINVFSSSLGNLGTGEWKGSATVRDLPALLVTYGSGSASSDVQKTFFVSGSGNTFIGGVLSSSQDVYVGNDLYVAGNIKGIASSTYAKAWVNFGYINGNVVMSSSYNISPGSITRLGTPGEYTIVFDAPSPFTNKDYVMTGTVTLNSLYGAGTLSYKTNANGNIANKTTSQVTIKIWDNSNDTSFDPRQANIVFFGY